MRIRQNQSSLPVGSIFPESKHTTRGKIAVKKKTDQTVSPKKDLRGSEANDRRFFVEGMDFALRNQKKAGLTRGKLAKKVGISGAYLSMLLNPSETGNFDIDLAARLAHELNYSLTDLIALGHELLAPVIGDPSPPKQQAVLDKIFIDLGVNPSHEQRVMLKNIFDTIVELDKAG
jgi:transcriptional regulator with XRE-family HTH domain